MKLLLTIVLLSLSIGCFPLIRFPSGEPLEWVRVAPDHYRYQDADLQIDFQVGDRSFLWRFKNIGMLALEIDHRTTNLRLEGEPIPYTLWGEPRNPAIPMPVIRIEPSNFIALFYPVQNISPLYPFPPKAGVTLEFEASWEGRPAQYVIRFPTGKGRESD